MASIFQIGISQNTKCALKDGFRKSSHINSSIYSTCSDIPHKIARKITSNQGFRVLLLNISYGI